MRKIVAGLLSGLGLTAAALSPAIAALDQVADQADTAGAGDALDPAAVDALVAAIRQAITALPADAPAEDIEAAITFAFDQSGQPVVVLLAALDQLERSEMSEAILAAIRTMRRLAQNGQLGSGTSALANQALNQQLTQSPDGTSLGGTDYTV